MSSMIAELPPVAILAGGLATRLYPITEKIPKALVDVEGRPFILHQLEMLRRRGLTRVVLCVGHMHEMIREVVGDGHRYGMHVTYSLDGETLRGTGGAIKQALPLLGDAFYVTYGDSYLNCDYRAVYGAFRAAGHSSLMTVFHNENQWDTSNVLYREGRILLYDKRQPTHEMKHIDYGLSLMTPAALESIPDDGPSDLADTLHQLSLEGHLAGYEVFERFYEVGSHNGLAEMQAYIGKRQTSTLLKIEPAPENACKICEAVQTHYAFTFQGYPIWRCEMCDSLYLNPQPTDEVLAEIYGNRYFLGADTPEAHEQRKQLKQATARGYLDQLKNYRKGLTNGSLLEVGCGQGEFLIEAEAEGYDVTGVEYSAHAVEIAQSNLQRGHVLIGEVETADLPPHSFDVVVSTDVIEHVRDPKAYLRAIHRVLKPGGILLMVTISLDTLTAKVLQHRWMEFKIEHMHYFSDNALHGLLMTQGYHQVRRLPAYKRLTPAYVMAHFERYPISGITPLARFGYRFIPGVFKQRPVDLTGSGVLYLARATETPLRRKLSVIVPAYNESSTFTTLMDELSHMTLDAVDLEIIIVESNSTDGTREQAMRYQNLPHVKLILQDKPRGKGNAVREGLAQATGDFILIQDADLEYDLHDYPRLLQPLVMGYRMFVLGSRHSGGQSWAMRRFEDNPAASSVLNIGHLFFATLLNLMYGQRLRDPFTMYKVFWRDCLDGLHFEANRFDFDFELVIKLLRKGYQPLEIPVNYQSRSFAEGKKVRFFQDPITWIRALLKFRVSPLYEDDVKPHTK